MRESVAKVIEVSAESSEGFDQAIRTGMDRAGKTVKNVQGAWIKEQSLRVKDGRIEAYRVVMKVTFVLE